MATAWQVGGTPRPFFLIKYDRRQTIFMLQMTKWCNGKIKKLRKFRAGVRRVISTRPSIKIPEIPEFRSFLLFIVGVLFHNDNDDTYRDSSYHRSRIDMLVSAAYVVFFLLLEFSIDYHTMVMLLLLGRYACVAAYVRSSVPSAIGMESAAHVALCISEVGDAMFGVIFRRKIWHQDVILEMMDRVIESLIPKRSELRNPKRSELRSTFVSKSMKPKKAIWFRIRSYPT